MMILVKRTVITILSLLMMVCVFAIFALNPVAALQVSPDTSPVGLFELENMNATADISGKTLKDGDGNVLFPNEDKTGVKLSSSQENSSAKINKQFTGAFEIDLRVWSDRTIQESDGFFNEFSKVNVYDLRELQIIFEDNAGQSFTIHIAGGDFQGAIRGTVRVSVNNGKDQYAYKYNDSTAALESYRANSYGTWLFGMGFANRSRGFKTNFTSDKTISTTVGFDPASMEVYGLGYSTDNSSLQKYTVWKLDNELTNSNFSGPAPTEAIRTLSSFGNEYNVTLKFADIEEGREAKAVIYSVCGQSLAGKDSFEEDCGPSVLLKNMPLGTAEKQTDLTQAVESVNDFFEGKISSFKGEIWVKGPDGISESLNDETGFMYAPPKEGDYTLIYKAKDSKGNLGTESSLKWTVLHAELVDGIAVDSLFDKSNTSSLECNVNSPDYADAARGVLFTTETAGSSITYKNKIKLEKNVPFIEFMVIPEVFGSKTFDRVALTLTDAHDPNNVLNITVHSGSWGNEYSYIRAGANNMLVGGWNIDKKEMQYTDTHGFVAMHSFTGESKDGGANFLSVFFNSEDLALTVSPTPRAENTVIIFDDQKYLGGQAPWYGFTNDEVYLSISLTRFTGSDPASILISKINGQSFDGNYLYDTKSPSLTIDTVGYESDDLPLAQAGEEYPIFAASAYDEAEGDISGKITCSAYYNYSQSSQRELSIIDNKIIPDEVGEVTLVYSVKDSIGNETVKTLVIKVVETLEEFEVVFETPIPTKVFVGERVSVPVFMVSGGSGNKSVQISVTKDNELIDFNESEFYFTRVGGYIFNISVTDYLGRQKTFEFAIEAIISEAPILVVGEFPPAYLVGYSYDLPQAKAVDWGTSDGEGQEVPVAITACYEGETPFSVDGKFVPSKTGEATIVYTAIGLNGEQKLARFEKKVTVLSGDCAEDLFIYEYGTVKAIDTGLVVATTSGGKFRFVNAVFADVFTLRMQCYEASGLKYNSFKSFVITLYEIGNRKNSIEVKIPSAEIENFKGISKTQLGRLAGKMVYVEFSFEGVTDTSAILINQFCNQPFSKIPYDIIKPIISVQGNIPLQVDYGKIFTVPSAVVFDIFDPNAVVYVNIYKPDGSVYCEDAFISKNIKVLADSYGVFNIEYVGYDHNGNKLYLPYSVKVGDTIAPKICIDGNVPKSGEVGKNIKLPKATAYDNYSDNLKVFVFVIAPNGKMYEINEFFKPEQRGEYQIIYYAVDEAYNYVNLSFTVNVK